MNEERACVIFTRRETKWRKQTTTFWRKRERGIGAINCNIQFSKLSIAGRQSKQSKFVMIQQQQQQWNTAVASMTQLLVHTIPIGNIAMRQRLFISAICEISWEKSWCSKFHECQQMYFRCTSTTSSNMHTMCSLADYERLCASA